MTRKLITGIAGVYVLGLAILVPLLIAAAPGPEDRGIPGVGIGGYGGPGGIVYLSGRRLSCTDGAGNPPAATCSIEIEGQTLTLYAQRDPNGAGGTCSANYAGRAWPCEIGMGKTVSAPWSVYVEPPLGLNAAQMDALRARYPIENLGETPFLVAALVLPILNVLVVVGVAWLIERPAQRKNVLVWVANVGAGAAIWLLSVFYLLRLTSGFWD